MADVEWYYGKGGQKFGPVSQGDIQNLIVTGQLSAEDFVWRAGFDNWIKAGTAPEFRALLSNESAMGASGQLGTGTSGDDLNVGGPIKVDFDIGGGLGKFGELSSKGPRVSAAGGGGGGFGGGGDYAGFWKRFVAIFLDGLILTIPSIILVMGAGFLIGIAVGSDGTEEEALLAFQVGAQAGNFVASLLSLLYFALMESSRFQGTLGKMALGIQVTDLNGEQITFLRALGRNFGKIISQLICLVGFIMAGFTERKQALHDMMAGCLVVNK